MKNRARGIRLVASASATLIFAACGDLLQEPDTGVEPVPVQIEEVSGNDQVGAAGAALAQPLRVRLVDREGDPIRGLWIRWTVVEGSGAVEPRNGFTDASGIAEATWVLGAAAGPQQVEVLVGGGPPITFEATAAAP
ncbi:MAG TPA: hypothetical protein VIE68_07715 [Gemmatimonadota bacterium]|jgi:hypothetical protein